MIFLVIFLYTLHHRPFLSFFVLFPGSKKDEKDEKDVEDEKGQGVFLGGVGGGKTFRTGEAFLEKVVL